MFEIKGTAILGLLDYVRSSFGEDGHARWLAALSPQARELAKEHISATAWYSGPLTMEMRRAIIDLFLDGRVERIQELGAHSAAMAFRGVYRLAIKVGSPAWLIDRIGMVYGSYLRPGRVQVTRQSDKHVEAELVGFPDPTAIMENVMAGFITKGLELSGAKNITAAVTRRMAAAGQAKVITFRWS